MEFVPQVHVLQPAARAAACHPTLIATSHLRHDSHPFHPSLPIGPDNEKPSPVSTRAGNRFLPRRPSAMHPIKLSFRSNHSLANQQLAIPSCKRPGKTMTYRRVRQQKRQVQMYFIHKSARPDTNFSCTMRNRRLKNAGFPNPRPATRSEEHTSELQSLMRISYAVFCLKKKKT